MSTSNSTLTADRLRQLLRYEADIGVFTWAVNKRGAKQGAVAGCRDAYGYTVIRLDGILYKAHRLAWLYVQGEWPKEDIDHVDGDRQNNRADNLRDVSRSINNQNQRRAQSTNRSGYLGVSLDKHGKLWEARIKGSGAQVMLGRFSTPELAHAAYIAAKREMHPGCTI